MEINTVKLLHYHTYAMRSYFKKISRISSIPTPPPPPPCQDDCQEPINRSVQLNYTCATAFSQVRLFLD